MDDELRVLRFMDRTYSYLRLFRSRARRDFSFQLRVSDVYTNRMGFLEFRVTYRVTRRVHNRNARFRATLYVNETDSGAYWARWERGTVVSNGPVSASDNMIVLYDDWITASGLNK